MSGDESNSLGEKIVSKLIAIQERFREFSGSNDLLTRFKIIYSFFGDTISMLKLEKHFENEFFRLGPLDERDPFSTLVVRGTGGKIINFGYYDSWSRYYNYVNSDNLSGDSDAKNVNLQKIVDVLEEVIEIYGLSMSILPIIMLLFFRKVTKSEYEIVRKSILSDVELMRFPVDWDEAEFLVNRRVTSLQLKDYYTKIELDNDFFSVFGINDIGRDDKFVDIVFRKGHLTETLEEMRQDYVETRGKEPMTCSESCLFKTLSFLGRFNSQWETIFVEIVPMKTSASSESIFNASSLAYIPAPPWLEELIVETLAKHNGALSVSALLRSVEIAISQAYSENREDFLFACDLVRLWSFQKRSKMISFYPSAATEKNDEGRLMWRENVLPPLMKTDARSALKRGSSSSFPTLISLENAFKCPIERLTEMYDDENHGSLFMIGFCFNCCGGDVGESLSESFKVERNRSILATKPNKHDSEIKTVEMYFKNRRKKWEQSYPKN